MISYTNTYVCYIYIFERKCIAYYFIFYMLGSKPTLSELHRMIGHKYVAKWRELGTLLNIPMHILNEFAADNKNHPYFHNQCCLAMLEWLMRTTEPTWDIIHKAINDLPSLSSFKST